MFSSTSAPAPSVPSVSASAPPAQGFAAFAPQTSGFAAAASAGTSGFSVGSTGGPSAFAPSGGFSFGASQSTPAAATSTTGGFSFGGTSAAKPPSSSLFGPCASTTNPSSSPFGPRASITNPSNSPFGPRTSAEPPALWKPQLRSSGPAASPASVGARSNPLGRGLSTRACFAVNDDQRFVKPAFGASKPSPWAMIKSISAATTQTAPPPQSTFTASVWTGGSGVPGWGERVPAPTTTSYAPTSIVELNGQKAQLMSVSAMPTHQNLSVEEFRLATRGQSASAQRFPSRSPGPFSTTTAPSGLTFGVDRNSPAQTSTVFGLPPASTSSGNPFSSVDSVGTPPPFSIDPPSRATSATVSTGSGGFLFSLGPTATATQSNSPFGVVPTGASGSADGPPTARDGGLFAPRAPGTFTPLFGTPSTITTEPPKPSLFWKPPTAEAPPLPAPRPGFLIGTNVVWTGMAHQPELPPPKFSFSTGSDGDQTTSSVRFGGSESATGPTSAVDAATVATTPSEAEVASREAAPVVETTSTSGAKNESDSLALPRLPQSYAKIAGSRARAFVRRAGGSTGAKTFDTHSARLAVAAMTSSRKFSHQLSLSPAKKPIERMVVGRRDTEPWKHSNFQLKSSLMATSVHAVACTFMAETQQSEADTSEENAEADKADMPEQDDNAERKDDKPVSTMKPANSLDLDNYDL